MLEEVTIGKNSLCIQTNQLGPSLPNLFLKEANDLPMANSEKNLESSPYIHPKNLNRSQLRRPGSHLSHHRVAHSLLLKVIHLDAVANRAHFEKSNHILYLQKKLRKPKVSHRHLKKLRKRLKEEKVLKRKSSH